MLERLGRFLPVRRRRLREDIERAFERFFDDPGALVSSELALDIEDHDDHYTLKAEVPGLGEDDLEVRLEGNMLVIEGERKEEVKRRRVSEIYYGSLYRAVMLPEDARPDEIKVRLRRGVLEITVPRERREKRRIEVRA